MKKVNDYVEIDLSIELDSTTTEFFTIQTPIDLLNQFTTVKNYQEACEAAFIGLLWNDENCDQKLLANAIKKFPIDNIHALNALFWQVLPRFTNEIKGDEKTKFGRLGGIKSGAVRAAAKGYYEAFQDWQSWQAMPLE